MGATGRLFGARLFISSKNWVFFVLLICLFAFSIIDFYLFVLLLLAAALRSPSLVCEQNQTAD